MKTYAVAYIDLPRGDLKIKITRAENWWGALEEAFPEQLKHLDGERDLEMAKEVAFDENWLFDVTEVKA